MNTTIAEQEVSTTLLKDAENKIKQLKEATTLLDDLSCRIDWALDFSEYESIREHLSPLSYAIGDAHEEVENELERLIEGTERYKELKHINDIEFDLNSYLKNILEE